MYKILVVDDEAAIREAIALILASSVYLINCAPSALDALSLLERESYDLVLTDLRMPDMDGYQLAKHVRVIYPGKRVMLITAFPSPEAWDVFDAVVLKPFSVRTLRSAVAALLDAPPGGYTGANDLRATSPMAVSPPQLGPAN